MAVFPAPKGRPGALASLRAFASHDLRSGFVVVLVALPLCLGIAKASGCPPVAGLLTGIVGGLVASHLGSAALTIKGPAAGLIAIVLGAVTELTPSHGDAIVGYRRMLAVSVLAALVQLGFALARAGKLADFFPSSVLHGMLAAIGVIIISKQAYPLLGLVTTATEPLELIARLPAALPDVNPFVAIVGLAGLVLLMLWPLAKKTRLGKVPPQILVVGVGIGLSMGLGFANEHDYAFVGSLHHIGPDSLVQLPRSLLSAMTFPDFSAVASPVTWKYVVMFSLVGSLESLASAKAVDALDPGNHRSDLDRDLRSVALGNLVVAFIGGIPMITEIVRSSANLENGAKSAWSNFFHGTFLLLAVVLVPDLLARIPLAALGALLVFTGFRLASPAGFRHAYGVGKEQLLVFASTLLVTLATDLLVGVFVGIALKLVVHVARGVSPAQLVRLDASSEVDGDSTRVVVRGVAVFSNFLALRTRILAASTAHVVVDLAETTFVDHTTLERLEELHEDLGTHHRTLAIVGLEAHESASGHKLAARWRRVEVAAPA